jgi:tRNA (cmo5U34)-methyltransferase
VHSAVDISSDGRTSGVAGSSTASAASAASGWNAPEHAEDYLDRIGTIPPRLAAEEVLRGILPPRPRTVLDLGCGDGRLAALVLEACPTVERVVAIDLSPPMLGRARERFHGDRRAEVRQFDLADSLEPLGAFDVIVSGFAIHHLEDQRKRTLFGEVAAQLHPGGLFANLEVVASSSPELHAVFLDAIGRPADDPEDRLADTELQAEWMRQAGLADVHCRWRWRGFALLVGWGRGAPGAWADDDAVTALTSPA